MTAAQQDLFDTGDAEYDLDYIVNNPIPATCARKTRMCRPVEHIRAPSLDNVRCFWCNSELKPVDPKAYRDRIANLWRHISKGASAT